MNRLSVWGKIARKGKGKGGEGSTFSLSKCDFSRLFHTERSWHTYRFTVVFVSGRQDLPSDARAFSFFAAE